MKILKESMRVLKLIWQAIRFFFKEGGLDKASLLAYYSILSVFFLLTFFLYLFSKILVDPQTALTNVYPFSEGFFAEVSPGLIERASEFSSRISSVGIIGILITVLLAFVVIRKLVQYINEIFGVDIRKRKHDKSFFIRRLSEFSLLALFGLVGLLSFFLTNFISAITGAFKQNPFIQKNIDPLFIDSINHFLIKYTAPLVISFIIFFTIYKWIPEKKVYVRGALIAALLSTFAWEVIKRAYAFYLMNVSVLVNVLGKLEGSFLAIILFAFWMEISFAILLIGVKLTSIFDRIHAHEKAR